MKHYFTAIALGAVLATQAVAEDANDGVDNFGKMAAHMDVYPTYEANLSEADSCLINAIREDLTFQMEVFLQGNEDMVAASGAYTKQKAQFDSQLCEAITETDTTIATDRFRRDGVTMELGAFTFK